MTTLSIVKGDITRFQGDAIVNAANRSLMGGGGVDGAIHHASGPALNTACARLNGCQTGHAKITGGYLLPVDYIIHTVGPIYHDQPSDANELAACYRNSIALAVQNGCHNLAFPSISTGAYGYPLAQAAPIAVRAIMETNVDLAVAMVCFYAQTKSAYQTALNYYTGG